MKIIPITPYLTHLRVFGLMNAYLVHEIDGFTLVDTLLPGQGEKIIAAVQRVGQPIRRVVLTHAHMDHVGALDELSAALPDTEFLFTERTARLLSGDLSADPGEPQAKLAGGYPTKQTQPTRTISPNQKIGSLKVIASPGHSPDHVSFFDPREKTLICGDAFQTAGGLAVSGDPRWLFPLPALATWHKASAIASARALKDLQPARIAPGHGKVLLLRANQLDRVIERAEKKSS